MEFVVNGSKRNRKWCEALLPSFISQLGLTNSRKMLFVIIDKSIDDDGETGQFLGSNVYVVHIKKTRNLIDMGKTLAHEMVHIRQLAKGIIKTGTRGAKIWAGKRYSKNTPYLDQPWELDAFARTEILFRRAIEV